MAVTYFESLSGSSKEDDNFIELQLYVGCDGVIGGQRYDICAVCGGNNSTCRLISGLFTRPHLVSGYNYITDIPQNACNITISEVKQSNNLFALRFKNGSYILNGNWASNSPGTYNAVGTKFIYVKGNSNSGEFISSPGPTTHPLELLLLYRQPNPGIKYEYRVAMPAPYREQEQSATSSSFQENQNYQSDTLELNKYGDFDRRNKYSSNTSNSFSEGSVEFQGVINDEDMKPKSKSSKKKKFLWKITGYTPCSKTCGGGTQTPIHSCVKEGSQHQHVVAEKRCTGLDKPEKQVIRCGSKPCPAKWVVGEWGQCSVTCGEGVESREVTCKQEISPVLTITVSDEVCSTSLSPSLLRTKPCFRKPCPDGSALTVKPYWKTGTWSTCSTRCGMGIKSRTVQCMAESEAECSRDDRPSNEMVCDMGPCTAQRTNEWLTSDWSQQCSETCGVGTQSRRVICSGPSQQEQLCDESIKPQTLRNCSSFSECGGRWFSSPWSRCSADCGWGKQVRTAICMGFNTETKSYSIAANSHCVEKEKPHLEQACSDRPCNPQWFAASWSACTRSCDSGVQRREVRCVNEDSKPSIDCEEDEKPATRRSCNMQRCAIYSDTKEIDSNIQETQTETASQSGANSDAKKSGNADCADKLNNCHLVTQARLCNYKYYKTFCCTSCFSLYHSPTNSTFTLANN
ncbi:hypothetical protein V9T40_008298 [Parthenolecanium corni]|uniref:PLAC domain-containing protein n=1 Tax=Parthenolecanium corni TaxID=536013 RepID=A0AAN9Y7R0_9HEMI